MNILPTSDASASIPSPLSAESDTRSGNRSQSAAALRSAPALPPVRSDLLNIAATLPPSLAASSSARAYSSPSGAREPSITKSTSSLSRILSFALPMPTRSASSRPSRIPAVSDSRSVTPPNETVSVRTSRVVPSSAVTIADASPVRRL